MNIAIVQTTLDARRGGAETSTLEMAGQLAALGQTVTLLAADVTPELQTRISHDHSGTRAVSVLSPSGKPDPHAFARAVDRHLSTSRYDVVHAVTPCYAADVYQPRGGTLIETIERSVAIGRTPLERWLRRLGRRFNRRQRALLEIEHDLLSRDPPPVVAAVSDYVLRQVAAHYPSAAARARVVFNGVNFKPLEDDAAKDARHALRGEFGLEANARCVLFVAHNFKLKGLAALIAARAAHSPAAAGNSSDWTLIVAGRDRTRPYERLAERMGVASSIRFVGATRPVSQLFAAADVLAHPTWYDPCSRVVLEALCAGVPVVTTRCNGAAEALTPGVHGEILDWPADPATLARAIDRCLSQDCATACRRDAHAFRERLSMRRHATELLALYQKIAATHA
ncbi:MAG: glycosyltransferase family 4 protein [Phycisphaerae bacterium]